MKGPKIMPRPNRDRQRETSREIKTGRKARVPLGVMRSRLSIENFNIPSNKKGRWVKDSPGRLENAVQGGYAFVEDPEIHVGQGENTRDKLSTKVCRSAGGNDVRENGEPYKLYLMMIDRDLYDEDQAEKQRDIDSMDDQIHNGTLHGGPDAKQYVPAGGISFTSDT